MEGIGLQVNELVNDVKESNKPGTCRTKSAHKNESKNKQIHLLRTLITHQWVIDCTNLVFVVEIGRH